MNRDFKGIWIPKEIWLNNDLTLLEKIILIEIDSLDNENHCIAGNDYLAEFCNCSERKVSDAIKKLTELGYIEVVTFDGRHRTLKSNLTVCIKRSMQTSKICEAESQNLQSINIDNNINNTSTKVDVQPKVDTEEKPKKKNLYEKCADMIELYCADDDDRLKAILLDYLPVRLANKEKPLRGANEWKGMLSKLFKMSESQDVLVEIVEDSLANGWACFVNPKEKKSFKKKDKQEIFGEHGQVFSDKSGGELADVVF